MWATTGLTMSVFFTSDTHFGDHRVLNLYPRPFRSAAEMDAGLVERWNAAVGPKDVVWHLGDFARTTRVAEAILPRLSGVKHLVLGNNDPPEVAGWAGPASRPTPRSRWTGWRWCSAITRSGAGTAWPAAASTCTATAMAGSNR